MTSEEMRERQRELQALHSVARDDFDEFALLWNALADLTDEVAALRARVEGDDDEE